MNITVRKAEPKDAPAIVSLIRELAAVSGGTSPITEAYAREYLSALTGTVLLAEPQGNVVGLLSYSLRPDLYHAALSCLIEELVVREDMRGQGVGSALLSDLFSRLSSLDCAEVSVTTMEDNTEAIKFYRKHGLTEQAVFLEKHFDRQEGT